MNDGSFVAIDVETANPDYSSICQIGAVRVADGAVVDRWASLVDPEAEFDSWYVAIHGITPERVRGQPLFRDLTTRLAEFAGEHVVVSHAAFDRVAVERAHQRYGRTPPAWTWIDTARVSRRAWPQFERSGYSLANVAKHCGIEFQHHDALEDARAAAEVFLCAMRDSGLDVGQWLRRARQPLRDAERIAREGDPGGPLAGEVVVFTGALTLPRARAAGLAAAVGCNVRDGVTAKTTMLVVGQQDLTKLAGYTKSSKHRKAEQLISQGADIRILGEDDFFRVVEIEASERG